MWATARKVPTKVSTILWKHREVHGRYKNPCVGACLMTSSATLAGFTERHSLRVKRDECHDAIVPGKLGHLYQHDASRFGIVLEASADRTRLNNTLRSRKRRAIAAGFLLHQEGDFESILLFDPADVKHARLAIRLIQAKRIRQAALPTDAQLRARALFSSKVRSRRPCFDQNTSAVIGQGDEADHSRGWLGRAAT
jgi:hypothetical protein